MADSSEEDESAMVCLSSRQESTNSTFTEEENEQFKRQQSKDYDIHT